MNAQKYAKALLELAGEGKSASLAKDFAAMLERTGRKHLLPAVIHELERIDARETERSTADLIASDERHLARAKRAANESIESAGGDPSRWRFRERVDARMIGGYVVRFPDRQLDRSHRRALKDLYDRLIS